MTTALLAAAFLTPDSPLLPRPEVRLREEWYPDGTVRLYLDSLEVGFSEPLLSMPGEFELWWMCADGENDGAFERGAGPAADRLRREVMREVGSRARVA